MENFMFNVKIIRAVTFIFLAMASFVALGGDADGLDLDEIASFELASMPELVSSVDNVRNLEQSRQKEIYLAYKTGMEQVSGKIMSSGMDADKMFEMMQKAEDKVTYELAQKYQLSMEDIGALNVIGQVQRW